MTAAGRPPAPGYDDAVDTYGEHPDMKLAELTQKLFYGRTA